MTKNFDEIYVVVKNNYCLFNNCIYDKDTAESIKDIAIDIGNPEAEVITLERCMEEGYLW
jgi:hypothetical protein